MTKTSTMLLIAVAALAIQSLRAQQAEGSVVIQPRVLSPSEFLEGESAYDGERYGIPGEITVQSSPVQDSAYRRALAIAISASVRFAVALRDRATLDRYMRDVQRPPSIWEQINRTMNIPAELLKPSPQEQAQYRLTLANAMYVPGVLLFPMGTGNVQISFGEIAKVFGIGEDVSPVIRYVVDETIEVEIVVYSSRAMIIATIFKGIQAPGAYTVTWSGKDNTGKPAYHGDYIAEVRLGSERTMRKRIEWKGR